MAEVVVPQIETEETKSPPKTDGPSRREQKAEAEKRREAEARERAEQAQRRRDLERERREARESTKRVAEETKKTVGAIKQAVAEKGGLRPVVSSKELLTSLPRQEVIKKLQEAGVSVEIPEGWDHLKEGQRADLLEGARIINEVEPGIEEKEIAGRKYLVWQKGKDTKQVYGFGKDLTKAEAQAVLKSFGIKEKVPRDWDKHGIEERKLWLAERGIEPLVAVEKIDEGAVIDLELLNLTRGQTGKIFGFKLQTFDELFYQHR